MTVQVKLEIDAFQPRAAMVEVMSADGRMTHRQEVVPGSGPQLFTIHQAASLRVSEGRPVPAAAPPAPQAEG